jgi:hypothetical protein
VELTFTIERSILLMMKGLIKTLSYIQLLLGIIGSVIVAYTKGRVLEGRYHYERSVGLTIGWFLVSLLSVLILFSILYSLYTILENQENILFKLSSDVGKKWGVPEKKLKDGEWRCSDCGKYNPNFLSSCGCGCPKPKTE